MPIMCASGADIEDATQSKARNIVGEPSEEVELMCDRPPSDVWELFNLVLSSMRSSRLPEQLETIRNAKGK